eukprot:1355303-Alexandrium_andersonii.AAC.1
MRTLPVRECALGASAPRSAGVPTSRTQRFPHVKSPTQCPADQQPDTAPPDTAYGHSSRALPKHRRDAGHSRTQRTPNTTPC